MKHTQRYDQHQAMAFADLLVQWYEKNKRQLPWRRERDPYRIWVSEIMLQQTRVEAVIPYYERFMEQFPTLQELADAPEDRVLKAWEGLGYYSRARNLHQAVREVQTHYNGIVPDEPDAMGNLPGVGPYTLGAVLSIAYNKEIPAVDGNVMRVISRVFYLYDDIGKQKTRKTIEQMVQQMIPTGKASQFNQGLMELGALVCIPGNPRCLGCPVQTVCRAYAEGVQKELPVKEKKKPPREQQIVVPLIEQERKIWINRRSNEGLLAGLWQLPTYEVTGEDEPTSLQTSFYEQYGFRLQIGERFFTVQHVFSHIKWNMNVYKCFLSESEQSLLAQVSDKDSGHCFVPIEELEQFTFPNVHLKILSKWKGME
ncbi:A/G-specific adenine glycosylase [Fodinisporobacter ferrooxydans]|uniref:Adenine DNA glycosylase n=1 Tax=Fodinisporobacter ferrooxydans TaxID=2901836 RepID=A0ABY4CKM2_9BACL|nr:A/G-specific adenine glycosylase [Alicyclobacillaceae bacterium MYW30-H2]